MQATTEPPKYPSSSKKSKDWNKVEKEIEKEEAEEAPEGEAGLNALFQKIYAGGTDTVKRAMNKSFVSHFYKNFHCFCLFNTGSIINQKVMKKKNMTWAAWKIYEIIWKLIEIAENA